MRPQVRLLPGAPDSCGRPLSTAFKCLAIASDPSVFKRGVIGTYHYMSEAHLGRYCAEFDCRYNTRDMTDGERAALILKGGEGRRLTYRRTDKLAA